jgi:hypothetical protein
VGSKTFSITYGTGAVNGTTATDTVHFAGQNVDLQFGLASGVSNDFATFPLDGILGFGRLAPDPSAVDGVNVLDALVSKGLVKSKVMGVHLSRHSTPPNDGQLNLGEPNTDLYDGDLNWMSAEDNTRGFWQLPIDDAGVDGKSLSMQGWQAILDTGTSFLLLPPKAATTLHGGISGSSQSGDNWLVPCNSKQVVQVTFGGKSYNIQPADYVGDAQQGGNCYSRIVGKQTFDDNQWLLGDVFLKNVYTVFDFDQGKIGLGYLKSSSEQSSSSQVQSATASSGSGMVASISSLPVIFTTIASITTPAPTNSAVGSSVSSGEAEATSTYTSSAADVLTTTRPFLEICT